MIYALFFLILSVVGIALAVMAYAYVVLAKTSRAMGRDDR